MSKEQYRFVHLSDIHFGQERRGTFNTHEDARAQLLRDCREFREQHGVADGILVNGDIAFSGTREEYTRAGRWLEELVGLVGCELIAVRTIPGNHDVDRNQISPFCEDAHDKLRRVPANEVDGVLERYMAGEEAGNPLLPKVAAYREFASRFGCDFPSAKRPSWRKDYPLGPQYRIALVGMNSVQVCDGKDAEGQMLLGNAQYVFPEEDDVAHVVLIHHPLHWFRDRADAGRYLNRAPVVMLGHEHALGVKKVQTDLGTEQLVVEAGATNPPEDGAGYPYRYNWVEFGLTPDGPAAKLRVTVHPRVWDHARTRFGPDVMRLAGRSESSFEVACPNFRPRVQVAAAPAAAPASPAPEVHPAMTEQAEGDDRDFERLQYYFWTFLDWHARLKGLVEVDVLPATQAQPVPQTFERLALNEARRRGRLGDLWEIVMRSVPPEKRSDNPFTVSQG